MTELIAEGVEAREYMQLWRWMTDVGYCTISRDNLGRTWLLVGGTLNEGLPEGQK